MIIYSKMKNYKTHRYNCFTFVKVLKYLQHDNMQMSFNAEFMVATERQPCQVQEGFCAQLCFAFFKKVQVLPWYIELVHSFMIYNKSNMKNTLKSRRLFFQSHINLCPPGKKKLPNKLLLATAPPTTFCPSSSIFAD